MPSTFTANFNLELMATGEFSGTWGQRLDNNVFSILDAALGNTLSLPLTNTNVTLNTAQSQNNLIDLSGTLTGNVQIIFPQIGRTYFVRNGTTGAFSVTLKTSAVGGATYVLPQGQARFFVLNGTDVIVANEIATQAAAQAGTNNTDYMTPLRTNQAIQLLGIGAPAGQLQGDMLYATAPNVWARLPKGTAGQIVSMNPGATAPQWSDAIATSAIVDTSTGATSYDVTGIPSWARRVTIAVNGISFASSQICFRVGSSGGIVSTGYGGTLTLFGSGTTNLTTSIITGTSIGADIISGVVTLLRIGSSNVWAFTSSMGWLSDKFGSMAAGSINVVATLDRVRLTTTGGSATGDAGTMAVTWE